MTLPTAREDERPVGDAGPLWDACAAALRQQVSDAVWLTTFNLVEPIDYSGEVLTLGVPNSLVKDRIEGRYRPLVLGALTDTGAAGVDLAIEVIPQDLPAELQPHGRADDPLEVLMRASPLDELGASATAQITEEAEQNGEAATEQAPAPAAENRALADRPLPAGTSPDSRYTFEAFVTGQSNRFAHAAALSVAETPARSYNPLFIYGDAGLGKTHLLMAISHYVGVNYPNLKVIYVSTETFLNQFVESIRRNTLTEFKRRYRAVDVLLVDDIQFMEGKEGLQEEFFHTFNTLYEANRQIVISSDRPPDSISTLEDRLRSRFKMGLITDIQPPDLETRLAILRKKAEQQDAQIPHDVLEFIATNITNNIRELEGALIRVVAYANLSGEPLDLTMAGKVLSDSLVDSRPRVITPELILEATSIRFQFSVEEIQGKSRRRPLVTARQVAMYVTRELTDLSYPGIARVFGGRDHTTVIHAVEKISALMKERRQIYDQVTDLIAAIKSGDAP
ncbi:MAG: chromosomal replication initiator protein DnaA [Actinomycetota bacterium]|nr:chromosomal replication initiator protein DnaA [Actinomycetota bacterium]